MWNLDEQEDKMDVKSRIKLLSSLQEFMEGGEDIERLSEKYGGDFVNVLRKSCHEKIQELLGEKVEKEIKRIDYTVASIQTHLKKIEECGIIRILDNLRQKLEAGIAMPQNNQVPHTPPPPRPPQEDDGLSPDERQARLKTRFMDQRGQGMY